MSKDALKEDYQQKLHAMGDDALVEESETYVWLSGYAANNPRSDYHWKCDACYEEARLREKPWLYQRGWNKAFRSAGYEPSEYDLKAAMEPSS